MPQLQAMVARVKQNLYGYSSKQEQYTFLSSPIGASDLTFTVADPKQVSRGMIEIGNTGTALAEIILVNQVNHATGVVTVQPGGRGYGGTTASSWGVNAVIENNPIFPQIRIIETINSAIRSVYPDLFVVGTTKFPKISVKYNYPMPAVAEEVIQAKYQIIGPSGIYPRDIRWYYDNNADTTDFPTGKSIWVGEEVTPGREIMVVYMSEPSELANLTDDFVTVTGLPSTAQDVIVYGSIMEMIPALSGPRMILDTVESSERAALVQNQQIVQASQYYGQLYQQKLAREARKLVDRYPRNMNFSS